MLPFSTKTGSSAKLGKDIVGEAFGSALKSYRDNYSKLAPGSDEILVSGF